MLQVPEVLKVSGIPTNCSYNKTEKKSFKKERKTMDVIKDTVQENQDWTKEKMP